MTELIRPNNAQKLPPDGPALFSNASHIVVNGGACRLVFLETVTPGAEPKFRTAVVMPLQDVMSLKNALVQLCSQVTQVQPPVGLNVAQ